MGKEIYLLILLLLMALNIRLYKNQLGEVLPFEVLKNKRKQVAEGIMMMRAKRKNISLERELFSSSVTLKNLSIVKRDAPISADYIYERLVENSGYLKPVYSRMLTLYRMGNDTEAFEIVAKTVGTKSGKNFANILSKLDKLNPAQLVEQMEMFQESLTESAMTAAMKRAQRNSLIITSCAAASVFALLVNFTVVVVFMKTVNILNQIFV